MPERSYNVAFSGNQYKFGSKELDDENNLNWYHFEARRYDPEIARFTSIDPLMDKYPSLTPYNYVANNPLRFIDPTGEAFYDAKGKRISEKKAYSMLMKSISNYLTNAKSNYKTSYDTRINFFFKSTHLL